MTTKMKMSAKDHIMKLRGSMTIILRGRRDEYNTYSNSAVNSKIVMVMIMIMTIRNNRCKKGCKPNTTI